MGKKAVWLNRKVLNCYGGPEDVTIIDSFIAN